MSMGSDTILMVGGANAAMNALAGQVRGAGKSVENAADGDAAKQSLRGAQSGLAVVCLDTVPDALDLIRELTFLFRGLPILAASAEATVHLAKDAIDAGAADLLVLPVDAPTLSAALKQYAGRFFDPELGRGRKLATADPQMQKMLTQVRRVAKSKATVLIQGESGTGKELMARFVHQVSDRAEQPFIAINCAALPENLLESELFGHVKGAFTGATSDRKGKFLQANGGTIFLDEISEMSLPLQAKLLRVLQEREVDPVGGKSPIELDVRVVASTNRDLKNYAADGNFREDLYFRLNVFPVQLPPLRKRPKDILLLAEVFRNRFIEEFGRNDITFSDDARMAMASYPWPGNIRELENVIQRALLVAEGNHIKAADLMIDFEVATPIPVGDTSPIPEDLISVPVGATVREMEEILIRRTLDEVDGNRTRAAEILGISIRTLRNKLNEYAARLPDGAVDNYY
ncbi:sigma-54-dependent transcriptional regulator [Magnetofaba australis]|uniref:Putative two component, sigma54 specific, Fis family transcriptional regulator n=1 Tax=Magnetofaba australis IT-1 TaxID=1434232 RepID=A0A1Y2K0R5_9PROT|nr:sigma-54 dependent transcriptional regulator [Magnetofaba australis]OSM01539.1 putative two component, sigma54 specific, Fis family transcriptional regulator [Magnetofaba australis IT-1]